MNYTMMGDSVNLAARLEEAAKQYGIYIQISGQTLNSLLTPRSLLQEELTKLELLGNQSQ